MIDRNNEQLDIYNGGYHAVLVKPINSNHGQECTQLSFNIPDYPDQSFMLSRDDIPSFIDYLQAFHDSNKSTSE
ncbi:MULTISPECIES: hypothetical protein [unclassified Psychrobacter]|uniref:hypothetical protein n=1 Tax=unclassified Psychrobacter TaxID=196806 RepID=UPI003FD96288